VAADAEGNVYVVWHGQALNAPVDEAHRAVYAARSSDEGKTFAPERRLNPDDTGACACCGLKAFAAGQGLLAVLYRSAGEGGTRDAILLVSTNYGGSFQSKLLGSWRVSTCPMSTQALGAGQLGKLVAMWETQGQVYRAVIAPAQLKLSAASLPPEGSPGNRKHPVFALSPGPSSRVLMAWVEGAAWGRAGTLAWECLDLNSGARSSGQSPGVPAWSLPSVVPEPDGSFTVLY
jgi:hypothetical protein